MEPSTFGTAPAPAPAPTPTLGNYPGSAAPGKMCRHRLHSSVQHPCLEYVLRRVWNGLVGLGRSDSLFSVSTGPRTHQQTL